ncbi:hypothetical protein KUTeg_001054 [Tegillarca granosa]|uniref:Uncharacterized protein n=1 Tax=Tegillarca granosa TaxID=220873 RepID=A0ABQ9FZD4_TEGGR|nr:hypothetical protein KUTeg_001054 [Tegillarca granosa]
MEGRARRYYERNLKEKVLFAWSEYASREKIEMMLKKRCFNTLREYPVERIKEKERRKRREEMRQKVASMLPDFEASQPVQVPRLMFKA